MLSIALPAQGLQPSALARAIVSELGEVGMIDRLHLRAR